MANGNFATVRVSLLGSGDSVVAYTDMEFADVVPDVHTAAYKAAHGHRSIVDHAGYMIEVVMVVRALTALARAANGTR